MQDNEPWNPNNPANNQEPVVNTFEPSGVYRPEDFNDQSPVGGSYNPADLIHTPEPPSPVAPWGWDQV